jgi:hypothetical protein
MEMDGPILRTVSDLEFILFDTMAGKVGQNGIPHQGFQTHTNVGHMCSVTSGFLSAYSSGIVPG